MMLCENVATKPLKQDTLYKLSFRGITAMGDMALWQKPLYNDHATVVLLSLYGSENQLRGIFSALASNYEINLSSEILTRGWDGNIRFKDWRTGYGKYHALIWNEKLISECIIAFKPGKEEVWESFLQRKRIPILKEWIPQIAGILEKEGLVETLEGINLRGWHFKASDDEVCDWIVKKIYK